MVVVAAALVVAMAAVAVLVEKLQQRQLQHQTRLCRQFGCCAVYNNIQASSSNSSEPPNRRSSSSRSSFQLSLSVATYRRTVSPIALDANRGDCVVLVIASFLNSSSPSGF